MVHARVPRRFAGFLIDLGFCVIVMLPICIWFTRGLFSEQSGIFLLGWSRIVLLGWMLLRLVYLGIGWSNGRSTLGCRLLSLGLGTPATHELSLPRSFLRSFSYLLIPIGWIPLVFTHGRLNLYDLVSGSRVYRTTDP
jgi:uncharacterized RDD family membrane protein YckC